MIPVFVASSARFEGAEWLTPFSIQQNTQADVAIHVVRPESLGMPETGCTGFTNLRYAVPQWCRDNGYPGAIYFDVDMLVLSDVADLWRLYHPGKWVTLTDGSDEVSIFSSDLEFLPYDLLPGENKHTLSRLNEKVRAIPLSWNVEDRFEIGADLIHYTNLDTQPWDVEHPDPAARSWYNAYRARYLSAA